MSIEKTKYILNLVEEISDSLKGYFTKNSFELLSRDQVSNYEEIDYILVETAEEANIAAKDFSSIKNDIAIVCLGAIKETKNFLLNNGRLSIDEKLAETDLGEQILNKFFNKRYNIHLDESFSSLFTDPKEFKITNHLSAGLYVDEVCVDAFEKGFNIVALRSFMDHTIYYFTYLKQAGLAGVPYEVEYSNNENFFVINTYLSVRNFVAEYMIDSFGPVTAKDPLQYLLGVVARSTDFLEITYIENPGRLVLTAVWGKNDKKRINGLAFNNVNTTAQTIAQLDKKVKEYKDVEVEQKEIETKEEALVPRSLPGGILEMVVSTNSESILNKEPEKASNLVAFAVAKFEEQFPDRSINDIEEEEFKQILSDYSDEEVIQKLSDEDKDHLLDRVQKNNITEAYDEEIQRVRDNLEDEEDFKTELQDTMTTEVAKRVSGHLDAEVLNKILGSKDEKEASTTVKGSKEKPDDFVAKISGMDKNKDGLFMQTISSSFEKQSSNFNVKISSSKDPNEKKGLFRNMINSTVNDVKTSKDLKLTSSIQSYIDKKMPKDIELGMEEYAKKIGVTFENLSLEQLQDFQENELPNIVGNVLNDQEQIDEFKRELEESFDREDAAILTGLSPEFEDKFKLKLETKLADLGSVEKVEDRFVITDEQVSDEKLQTIIQETMKETMDEQFKLEKATKKEIEEKEKQIIKDLSKTLNVETKEMEEIVKGGVQKAKDKEVETVVNNIFKQQPGDEPQKIEVAGKTFEGKDSDSNSDKTIIKDKAEGQDNSLVQNELIKKLKKAESENKKLINNVKLLESKLQSSAEGAKALKEIDDKAKEVASEAVSKAQSESGQDKDTVEVNQNVQDAEKIVADIKAGKQLSTVDADAISKMIKKEQDILAKAKNAETEIKKYQIELNQKEAIFSSELSKLNRLLKGKEMVVDKMKESMQTVVAKKDKEAKDLVKQIETLNQRLNNDVSTKLASEVKSLKMDNEQLAKSAEMFKNRLDAFTKSKKARAEADNSKQIADENRSLKAMKNQLENKMNALVKEQKSWEMRFNKSRELENKFRVESTGYKAKVSDLEAKLKQSKENEARLAALAEKNQNSSSNDKGSSSADIDALKAQNLQLQTKIKEIIEKQKDTAGAGSNSNTSSKEKILEKDKKRLQSELGKAKTEVETNKKEMMKMKGEQTKLKNEITKLKKELERAGANKKGSAKKAA